MKGKRSVNRRVPGTGGVGLLDGDLVDAGLVDPVDYRVSQLTHQLNWAEKRCDT